MSCRRGKKKGGLDELPAIEKLLDAWDNDEDEGSGEQYDRVSTKYPHLAKLEKECALLIIAPCGPSP